MATTIWFFSVGSAQTVQVSPARMQPQGPCDPRQPISALPFTIDACGSYFLTDCLTALAGQDGITIDADDVTLDLNGFALIGVAGSGDGISAVPGRRDIRITNGVVRGFGGDGIDLSAEDGQLHNVRALDNGGFGIVTGTGALIVDCVTNGNGLDGMVGGFASVIRSCTSNGNSGNGIVGAIAATTTGCVIRSSAVRANGGIGILTGDGSSVTDCASSMNGGAGIQVGVGCVVAGSTASLNNGAGIVTFGSLVRGNAAVGNGGVAIDATGSTVLENHQ